MVDEIKSKKYNIKFIEYKQLNNLIEMVEIRKELKLERVKLEAKGIVQKLRSVLKEKELEQMQAKKGKDYNLEIRKFRP